MGNTVWGSRGEAGEVTHSVGNAGMTRATSVRAQAADESRDEAVVQPGLKKKSGKKLSGKSRRKGFYFQINPEDLRVEVSYVGRIDGPGPEFVRILHLPSGISVAGHAQRPTAKSKLLTELERRVWDWQNQLCLPEIARKRPIRAGNLTLRFYAREGWTKEALDALCLRGEVRCHSPNDEDPYYTLAREQGSRFDCERLLECCSSLHRAFDDYPNESDLEYLERLNR